MGRFFDLLHSNPDQYIGLGNPAAEICFVGKEATGELTLEGDLGSMDYWDKSMPLFFDRNKADNPSDPIWKEGHTWNKYQKLHDAIFPELAAKPGTMNFEQRVFVTEMSAAPATKEVKGELKKEVKVEVKRDNTFVDNVVDITFVHFDVSPLDFLNLFNFHFNFILFNL